MHRRLSSVGIVILVVALSLGFAACGSGTVRSSDVEGPTPTSDASATSTPGSTPLLVTPQATPSSPGTPTPPDTADVVPSPRPSPVPEGLAACIGRSVVTPTSARLAGESPPKSFTGYARGTYAVNSDGSDLRYVAAAQVQQTGGGTSSHTVWSPDGTKIAFIGSSSQVMSLKVLDVATGEVSKLEAPRLINEIKWDPLGQFIEAWGMAEGDSGDYVYLVPINGGASIRLMADQAGATEWSPNGQCLNYGDGGRSESRVLARDGTLLATVFGGAGGIWSPDGSRIALNCNSGFRDGTCLWQVGSDQPPQLIGEGRPEAWSPDGTQILAIGWTETGRQVTMLSLTGGPNVTLGPAEEAALSPDGGKVAVIRGGNLYVTLSSGGETLEVTDSILPFMVEPRWSPDGTTIMFSFAPESQTFVANADGTGERLLLSGDGARWSPDGSRIFFGAGWSGTGAGGSFYVVDLTTGALRRLADYYYSDAIGPCRVFGDAKWSPDGRYVVFDSDGTDSIEGGTFVVAADGSEPPRKIACGVAPGWSPDGQQLVCTGMMGPPAYSCAVYVAPLSGVEPRLITEGERAVWSPRGDYIAFAKDREVRLVKPDGTGERTIVGPLEGSSGPSLEGMPYRLTWSPDGRRLAYVVSGTGPQSGVYAVNVDDGHPQPVKLGEGYPQRWTPDGTRLAVRRFAEGREVTYLLNADGSGEQRFVDGDGVDWSPDGTKILYSR